MITPVLPSYSRAKLRFVRGQGPWLEDEQGRRFLDFGAGIAVNVLGHSHPKLVETLKTQGEKLWHVSNLYEVPGQEQLAEALTEATFADTVFFTNSGTEATECAVKMARKYHAVHGTGRDEIITFSGAFHGRTLGMISAAGNEKHLEGFGPRLPGFVHVETGDEDALRAAVTDKTAALMIEPIQGESGIQPVPDSFLRLMRQLCDDHGLLLIFDEIQCGMGRTGKLFAYEWTGVTPDIMSIAKGIGGGFPLGACLATEAAAVGMTAGTHGSTYGGNPLACAIGNAVMEEVNTAEFLQHVQRISGTLRQKLEGLVDSHPGVFSAVRGAGLMIGLKCVLPNGDVVNAAREAGLLTVPGGDNVVRLLPPLNITEDDINDALERLETAATALEDA
ncbi:aspartate aminotransferase family protein [Paracoccaceae bacterium GXU_MW_L88]